MGEALRNAGETDSGTREREREVRCVLCGTYPEVEEVVCSSTAGRISLDAEGRWTRRMRRLYNASWYSCSVAKSIPHASVRTWHFLICIVLYLPWDAPSGLTARSSSGLDDDQLLSPPPFFFSLLIFRVVGQRLGDGSSLLSLHFLYPSVDPRRIAAAAAVAGCVPVRSDAVMSLLGSFRQPSAAPARRAGKARRVETGESTDLPLTSEPVASRAAMLRCAGSARQENRA